MSLPDDLLERPAPEAVRRIALAELGRARAAAARLAAGDDPEALHDFRVALRRLRGLLRAFGPLLDASVGARPRHDLKRLASASNPGRDAEVGLELLQQMAAELSPAAGRAATALGIQLTLRRDENYEQLRQRELTRFRSLARRLDAALDHWTLELRLDRDPVSLRPFRLELAERIGEQLGDFEAALDLALLASEASHSHRARIAAKRLRYLLEPVAPRLAVAAQPTRALKSLQELLGVANDFTVLGEEVARCAARAERKRLRALLEGRPALRRGRGGDGGRSGRLALTRAIAARKAEMREQLRTDWAPGCADRGGLESSLKRLLATLVGDPQEPSTRIRS